MKEKAKNLFTPDFFLTLLIFLIAFRFTSEVPDWFDIAQSDDNDYMFVGIHAFDEVQADWSPLYSFLFFTLHKFVPNPAQIYYLGMQWVGILLPLFSYLFLRRAEITRWFAAGTAVFLLGSYALWIPEPRVAAFATLVFIFIAWLISFFKKRWQRLWVLALSSLFFAYSRPEFFLVTLALSVVALSYFGFSILKRGLQLEKKDFLFLGISSSIAFAFLLWWGIPFSSSRTIYAFGQHYAENVQHCIAENAQSNMAWEEILTRDFNNPKNMAEVIQANPLNFRRHLSCNIQAFPKLLLKVAFSSAWGSSWFIIRIWAALILYRVIVYRQELKKRLLWLWENDFLLLPILSLGILSIDIILIHPREHYLVLVSIIIWL
ncbi:MAG: hypothetical protein GY755_23700 [Chloroflexi bacterium]|nr:hypothetical protein [Chloroflexota bacterium]